MTLPSLKAFGIGVLDVLFGKRGTPEELAVAREAALPSKIARPLRVVETILICLMLITFLWGRGWLPLVDSRLDRWWFFGVWTVFILLGFGRNQLEKHHHRRARSRMTPTP